MKKQPRPYEEEGSEETEEDCDNGENRWSNRDINKNDYADY